MTMAVKYHVSLCSRPRDLLLITLNHLDGVRAMVPRQTQVLATLDALYDSLLQVSCLLTAASFSPELFCCHYFVDGGVAKIVIPSNQVVVATY